ncbi:MAG TPA: hypothetical protein DCE14_03710 [Kosmotogaceae bacterium]|nr:MAG: hypothetical protein XE05_0327 [Thermotogales bacterium 46_20]HAA85441.1 hypothetical protein [Kosmotogaceae bacterium]
MQVKHTKLKTKAGLKPTDEDRVEKRKAKSMPEAEDSEHFDWILVFTILTTMSGESARCLPILLFDAERDRVLY